MIIRTFKEVYVLIEGGSHGNDLELGLQNLRP